MINIEVTGYLNGLQASGGGAIVILIKLPLTVKTSLLLKWTRCEGSHCRIPRLWQTLTSYINSFYFYRTPIKPRNSQLEALSFCCKVCFLWTHKSNPFPSSEQNLNQILFPSFSSGPQKGKQLIPFSVTSRNHALRTCGWPWSQELLCRS